MAVPPFAVSAFMINGDAKIYLTKYPDADRLGLVSVPQMVQVKIGTEAIA